MKPDKFHATIFHTEGRGKKATPGSKTCNFTTLAELKSTHIPALQEAGKKITQVIGAGGRVLYSVQAEIDELGIGLPGLTGKLKKKPEEIKHDGVNRIITPPKKPFIKRIFGR